MSVLIYRLAILLYSLGVRIASLFNPKARLFVAGRKGLLARIRYALIDERRPRIWMHCASLGEFEQGRPVLERLRELYPSHALVLTFFSPSGYEVRKEYKGADYVFYLPIDSPANARHFFAFVQPQLAIFVKYEFWYFYLRQLERKGIPTILISSIFRAEQPFFKWYGRLHRRMLFCFSKIFVQDHASAQLLGRVDVEDAVVAGDTRFDRVVSAASGGIVLPEIEVFTSGYKILIAGSSWPEDEALLQKALPDLPGHWKLIIVPHEVDEKHIADVCALFGKDACTLSEMNNSADKRVLIVDRIGVLLSLYKYSHFAWIGGGFGKGIHNTLEAAVYGMPIGFGPEFRKFREAKDLIATGSAFSTSEASYIAEAINNWDKDPMAWQQAADAARSYVQSHAGATEKIITYLSEKKLLSVS